MSETGTLSSCGPGAEWRAELYEIACTGSSNAPQISSLTALRGLTSIFGLGLVGRLERIADPRVFVAFTRTSGSACALTRLSYGENRRLHIAGLVP